MPLTDLFITYSETLAPAGFHKITLSDGGQGNNTSNNSTSLPPSQRKCNSPYLSFPLLQTSP
jgi:hypothetical protein